MSDGRRDPWFIAAALVVHGGFLLAAHFAPPPTYRFEIEKPMDVVEINVDDLPTEKETPRVDQPENDQASVDRRREEHPENTDSPRPVHGEMRPNESGPTEPETAGPSEINPPPTDEYDPAPSQRTWEIPGSGKSRAWQLSDVMPKDGPPAPAPTEAPREKKVDRNKANEVLSQDLRDKDKKMGLNPPGAGTVASAAKSAVWSADIPDEATGTLTVVIGPGGKVKSVKANSNSGGTGAAWDAVAANVKASLAGQTLKFSSDYDKGAVVVLRVQSKRQMPSGGTPGNPVNFGVQKGGGVGGSFDLGDIGAKPIRQVLSSIVSVTPVK